MTNNGNGGREYGSATESLARIQKGGAVVTVTLTPARLEWLQQNTPEVIEDLRQALLLYEQMDAYRKFTAEQLHETVRNFQQQINIVQQVIAGRISETVRGQVAEVVG